MATSRQLRILKQLLSAQKHHARALEMFIEDLNGSESTERPSDRPTRASAKFDPTVDTLSHSLANPFEDDGNQRTAEKFSRETALREMQKAWVNATTEEDKSILREMAKSLRSQELLTEEDLTLFA